MEFYNFRKVMKIKKSDFSKNRPVPTLHANIVTIVASYSIQKFRILVAIFESRNLKNCVFWHTTCFLNECIVLLNNLNVPFKKENTYSI